MTTDIIRSNTFRQEFQILGSDLLLGDGTPNPIISSTSDSPAKLNTKYPHGLSTGAKVYIFGIHQNPIVLGNKVITVTSPTQFTVPVAGQANSSENGTLTLTNDATSFTVTQSLVPYAGATAITGVTATLTWIDIITLHFYIEISATDTAKLTSGIDVYLKIHWIDSASRVYDEFIKLSVGNS